LKKINLEYALNELWGATRTNWGKVTQIKENPFYEFSMIYKKGEMNGFLRGRGKVEIITDLNLKNELIQAIPFFKGYWNSVDDPYYTLVKFKLSSVFISDPREGGDKISMKFNDKTGETTVRRFSREKYLNE
jgi:general stress protein 26